jgi:hypothetical protein
LLRGSSKEKAIIGAVAPKPALSTHPHNKLLGFLAFSHDVSFSTLSIWTFARRLKLEENLLN